MAKETIHPTRSIPGGIVINISPDNLRRFVLDNSGKKLMFDLGEYTNFENACIVRKRTAYSMDPTNHEEERIGILYLVYSQDRIVYDGIVPGYSEEEIRLDYSYVK